MIESTNLLFRYVQPGQVVEKSDFKKDYRILMSKGLKVVAVRHPMPYGNLSAQKVQRFADVKDLEKHNCTVEEMESMNHMLPEVI